MANLMFIRKSAEFFRPRKIGDKRDSLYSYLYPDYTRQGWIVPEETCEAFHKRVGHITVAEARHGKVAWPIFELSMQAMNQWADFFAAMATAYAADADTAALCARYAEAIRNEAADAELLGWLGFFQRGGELTPVVRPGRPRRQGGRPVVPGNV